MDRSKYSPSSSHKTSPDRDTKKTKLSISQHIYDNKTYKNHLNKIFGLNSSNSLSKKPNSSQAKDRDLQHHSLADSSPNQAMHDYIRNSIGGLVPTAPKRSKQKVHDYVFGNLFPKAPRRGHRFSTSVGAADDLQSTEDEQHNVRNSRKILNQSFNPKIGRGGPIDALIKPQRTASLSLESSFNQQTKNRQIMSQQNKRSPPQKPNPRRHVNNQIKHHTEGDLDKSVGGSRVFKRLNTSAYKEAKITLTNYTEDAQTQETERESTLTLDMEDTLIIKREMRDSARSLIANAPEKLELGGQENDAKNKKSKKKGLKEVSIKNYLTNNNSSLVTSSKADGKYHYSNKEIYLRWLRTKLIYENSYVHWSTKNQDKNEAKRPESNKNNPSRSVSRGRSANNSRQNANKTEEKDRVEFDRATKRVVIKRQQRTPDDTRSRKTEPGNEIIVDSLPQSLKSSSVVNTEQGGFKDLLVIAEENPRRSRKARNLSVNFEEKSLGNEGEAKVHRPRHQRNASLIGNHK